MGLKIVAFESEACEMFLHEIFEADPLIIFHEKGSQSKDSFFEYKCHMETITFSKITVP